jgi:hypothetical protein
MTRPSPRRTSTPESLRTPDAARAGSARPAPSPNAARRAARRRQEFGRRIRQFEASLPGLRLDSMRPALPSFSLADAFSFSGFAWSKLMSGALLAAAVTCLLWMQMDGRWYVYREGVSVRGQNLVSAEALVEAAGVEGWNLFWLQNSAVRERVRSHPWVGDAEVALTLPAGVRIQIKEKPAIGVWVTESGHYWISPTGSAMPLTTEAPATMPRLIDPAMDAAVPGTPKGTAVDTKIVASALALVGHMPGVTDVRYSPEIGLNFGLPGGPLYVYWGDGEYVNEKLGYIALGQQLVATGELPGTVLDVRFPDRFSVR